MNIISTRILVIDDDRDIWKAYKLVLSPEPSQSGEHLRELGELLAGHTEKRLLNGHEFELSFAAQGKEGCDMAAAALEEGRPYALAFVDVRMPPGIDGMETAARLHQIDPDIEIVIVTAYSDRSCDEIVKAVGSPHKLLFLRKPFDAEELKRLTVSLTDKWHMARKEEEQRKDLQVLLCTSPAAIFSLDDEQNILTWNQAAEYITGYGAREVIGGKCIFREIAEDKTCKGCTNSCSFEDQLTEHEFDIIDSDGSPKTLSMRISYVEPTKDRPGKSIGSFWDITTLKETQSELSDVNAQLKREIVERDRLQNEQIKLERKLHQAQKMEALGLMAGGVAHDLNNILSGLVGYPELLLMQLPKDSKMRESIMAISESGKRAAAVVSDLLTVARGATSIRETVDLNALIIEYLKSPEGNKLALLHPDVTIETRLDPGELIINCSPVHIKKCLMNLLTNAAEAITDKGRITIRTFKKFCEDNEAKVLDVAEGKYIVLAIADTGPGISPTDQERIFEPFYTKKSMGASGTGLGLTVVWNTVKDHNGSISLESSSAGTTFTLYIPASDSRLSKKLAAKTIDELKGTGTLLIVDDEKQQRDITSKMLSILGYKVKEISSGEEALAYLKENEVDLVLLDMIMDPGMNGRETYEKIIELRPNQKALFVSGYSQESEVENIMRLGVDGFVRKPFTLEQLGHAVQQELTDSDEEDQ